MIKHYLSEYWICKNCGTENLTKQKCKECGRKQI